MTCRNLVLATGGKSIPKMGATGLSYDIARRFGHRVTETRPALVPFTFDKGRFAELAGIAAPATVRVAHQAFDEAILFTHRGLSGPAVLQISSYWREGDAIEVTLLPDAAAALRAARRDEGRKTVGTWLSQHMPARLARHLAGDEAGSRLCDLSDRRLAALEARLERWRLTPGGTEGYRTAEVTLGGIATDEIDSRTMESRRLPGLFAIGEAVDVTGWLGGYNFQWAWASGHAAGTALAAR